MNNREQFVAALREDPHDEALRFVFSDWLEENGDLTTAQRLREGPVIPIVEITIPQLLESYDWEEVFGEGSGGNCDKKTDACPPGSDVDCTPPSRASVAEIIAAHTITGDCAEADCLGVFRLHDGRFLIAEGSCDTTGWD